MPAEKYTPICEFPRKLLPLVNQSIPAEIRRENTHFCELLRETKKPGQKLSGLCITVRINKLKTQN